MGSPYDPGTPEPAPFAPRVDPWAPKSPAQVLADQEGVPVEAVIERERRSQSPFSANRVLDRDGNPLPPPPTAVPLGDLVAQHDAEDEAAVVQGLSPYDVAGATGAAAGRAGARGDDLFGALMDTTASPSRPNPMAPIRKGYADEVQGEKTGEVDQYGNPIRAGGVLDRIRGANAAIGAAGVAQTMTEADAYQQEAARQDAINDAAEAQMIRDVDRRDRARDLQDHVFEQIQHATDKLLRASDVDAGRYWASRKTFQKVGWAISMIADGILGLDPMAKLNAAIEQDIGEQQANFHQAQSKVGGLHDQLGAARSLYADLRASIGDEEATADAMRVARYEQAKTEILAQKLRAGVPMQVAVASKEIAELDAKIADSKLAISEKLAKTPDRIGGGVRPTFRGPLRATLAAELNDARSSEQALRLKGIDQAGDASAAEVKAYEEARKARAAAGQKTEGDKRLAHADRELIIKESEKASNLLSTAQAFRAKYGNGGTGDIPGVVWGLGDVGIPGSDEDEVADFSRSMLDYQLTQWLTGASSPPEMQKRLKESIQSPQSEGEFWGALDEIERMAQADIERVRRGVEPDERAFYERTAPEVMQDFQPAPSNADPTDAADDERWDR